MTDNFEILAVALAAGRTVREASDRAAVSERTVYRRLKESAFQKRVVELRSDMVGRSVGLLVEAGSAAVQTLKELLNSQSDSVRLGAARSILELGVKLRESTELAAPVAELEAIAEENHESQASRQVA